MLETLSQVGELVGGIGALLALVYLALQIRQSNVAARAQARQTLIDTWSAGNWDLARDPNLLRSFAKALRSWPDVPDRDKTAFDIAMSRFLANIQNGILLHDAGQLDTKVLDQIADYMVATVASEGGGKWWNETSLAAPMVREYIDNRLAVRDPSLPTIDEMTPYWVSMADDD